MKYYYADSDKKPVGPLPVEALEKLKGAGIITESTMVIPEGASAWKRYSDVFPKIILGGPPPPDDAMVVILWQISKSSVMGQVISHELVIDGITRELKKTDIAVTRADGERLVLSRGGSAWQNKVAFKGEIRVSDAGDRIGVQLHGKKDRSKAAAGGLMDICSAILVCPPILCCTGTNALIERNYVEKTIDAIIVNMCKRFGATVIK